MKILKPFICALAVAVAVATAIISRANEETLVWVPVTHVQTPPCEIFSYCSNDVFISCRNSFGVQLYEVHSITSCNIPAIGYFFAE